MVSTKQLDGFPQLSVDAGAAEPMFRQLYERLRSAVLAGELRAGTRLPSTRALASALGVSRNTVMASFEQLLAEGYLEGRVGAGTYVTHTLPDDLLRLREQAGPIEATTGSAKPLSRRGELLTATPVSYARLPGPPRPFRIGVPAADAFPFELWSRLVARRWRSAPQELLGYGDPAGYRPLREAIAAYVGVARGVRCDAGQVVIVGGSQQALDLSARLLLDDGDAVWMEEPGYQGARAAFRGAGARVVPVPVDDEGLDVAAGMALCPDAAMAYVTPSHQFPLGATMSLSRRLALLEWAQQAGAWIIEDDVSSEYRYAGRPLEALQGLDRGGRVIYAGTFSKVLAPAIRLGYVVVPPDLVDAFVAARAVSDRHSPSVDQAALADFMEAGHFERHVRRMRALYHERQAALVDACGRELGGLLEVEAADAGMHLPGRLPPLADDVACSAGALDAGIEATALSRYCVQPPPSPVLLLGYTVVPADEALGAVRTLAGALRRAMS